MKPRYLVRPDDFGIFELDESNGCYRGWYRRPIQNQAPAMKHFTEDILVNGYGFFPILESELEIWEEKQNFELGFRSWQMRNDGHGGVKGGSREEYLQYLKRVEERAQ